MATPIQRTKPLTVTEFQRLYLLANTGAGSKLDEPQELVTTSDQLRLFRSSTCLGPAVWLGEVADEAAMLALHTTHPRGCWPVGDHCLRLDTGRVMECIAGNGLLASEWCDIGDGSGTAYQPADADLAAIAQLSTTPFGRALLTKHDARAVRAVLGVQATPANAAALERIGVYADLPTWDGAEWPGGGGGAAKLWDLPCIQSWYGPEHPPCGMTGPCADTAPVVVWQDLSRYGRTMVQTNPSVRPTYVAALQNDLGGIKSASGTAQCLAAAVNTAATGLVGDLTLWVAAKRSSATGLVGFGGSTDSARVSLYWEAGNLVLVYGPIGTPVPYTPTTDFTLIKVTLRGTTVTMTINGTALTPVTDTIAANAYAWTHRIGMYWGAVQGCDVTLGTYVLADGALTSDQESQIDTYLAALWGL